MIISINNIVNRFFKSRLSKPRKGTVLEKSLKLLSEHNTVLCLELPLRNEAEKEYAKDVEYYNFHINSIGKALKEKKLYLQDDRRSYTH